MSTAAILALIIAVMYGAHLWLRKTHGTYRYAERNPSRRVCTNCGQMQEEHCYAGHEHKPGWWGVVGEIRYPECPCNKDTRNEDQPNGT